MIQLLGAVLILLPAVITDTDNNEETESCKDEDTQGEEEIYQQEGIDSYYDTDCIISDEEIDNGTCDRGYEELHDSAAAESTDTCSLNDREYSTCIGADEEEEERRSMIEKKNSQRDEQREIYECYTSGRFQNLGVLECGTEASIDQHESDRVNSNHSLLSFCKQLWKENGTLKS